MAAVDWYEILNARSVVTPALLVYPERVHENIRRMIALAKGVERLRPHVKTHKLPEVLRMQRERGIVRFKCATVAEAEMTAAAGAEDVLLAYQLVGPNIPRVIQLRQTFPNTKFSGISDDAKAIRALSAACARAGQTLELLLDVDCGQHRTGVLPGPKAVHLYQLIGSLPGLRPGGLHVYDGHLHDSDPMVRTQRCEEAFAPVAALRDKLLSSGVSVPKVVAGGTPTFSIHARRGEVECSPGTCVFWDAGYGRNLPDLDFLPAALVLTRVVSKPAPHRLCLDLGHKAIASEMPHPRVVFLNLPDAGAVVHNEEHLVVETANAAAFEVGDCLYGIPWHICPTVALHSEAHVVEDGRVSRRWKVVGRERRLTI